MESQPSSLTTFDTIDKLLWPPDGINNGTYQSERQRMRIYNCLRRNGITVIAELLAESPDELLRMRMFGQASLDELIGYLDQHGWKLAPNKVEVPAYALNRTPRLPRPASRAPEGLEGAEWVGHQLDALSEDDRAYPRNGLGSRAVNVTTVEARRHAWAFYRWGVTPDAEWPSDKAGGVSFMAHPLPGSMELHLEGLNRMAREELGE